MFPSGKIGGRRELALMPWQNYGTDGIPERSMARIVKRKRTTKTKNCSLLQMVGLPIP